MSAFDPHQHLRTLNSFLAEVPELVRQASIEATEDERDLTEDLKTVIRNLREKVAELEERNSKLNELCLGRGLLCEGQGEMILALEKAVRQLDTFIADHGLQPEFDASLPMRVVA